MNTEIQFKAVHYGEGYGNEAVALVTGFAGEVKDLDQAARTLVDSGRDAILYTYDPQILLAGDAELLPEFIDTLSSDFTRHTIDYPRRRYAGASLGGAIAAGMQKNDPDPERGLFAATGVDAAELVMKNRLFRAVVMAVHHVDIRRAYEKNGYTLNDLKDRWHSIQSPPLTPFTIAVGGLDYIVRQRELRSKIAAWQKVNPDISVIRKPWLGHNGTIKWFNHNIDVMLGLEFEMSDDEVFDEFDQEPSFTD